MPIQKKVISAPGVVGAIDRDIPVNEAVSPNCVWKILWRAANDNCPCGLRDRCDAGVFTLRPPVSRIRSAKILKIPSIPHIPFSWWE
jgi:hypothetical protein